MSQKESICSSVVHCQKSSNANVFTSIFKSMLFYMESKNIDFCGRLLRICVPVLQDVRKKKFERHNAVKWNMLLEHRISE